ncbi:hypothetical protein ACH4UM_08425 [Streptomyces sp. NPDC020801]|uniref:hypothetical protein n=1 Tax=unclassified Streptomyces TaxID=2593676 RepID=UPI00379AACEA
MARHGSPWQEVTDGQVMGGVMKLGKALATGVAQERPRAAGEELELPEDIQQIQQIRQPEPQAAAPEEVPAAR